MNDVVLPVDSLVLCFAVVGATLQWRAKALARFCGELFELLCVFREWALMGRGPVHDVAMGTVGAAVPPKGVCVCAFR